MQCLSFPGTEQFCQQLLFIMNSTRCHFPEDAIFLGAFNWFVSAHVPFENSNIFFNNVKNVAFPIVSFGITQFSDRRMNCGHALDKVEVAIGTISTE